MDFFGILTMAGGLAFFLYGMDVMGVIYNKQMFEAHNWEIPVAAAAHATPHILTNNKSSKILTAEESSRKYSMELLSPTACKIAAKIL